MLRENTSKKKVEFPHRPLQHVDAQLWASPAFTYTFAQNPNLTINLSKSFINDTVVNLRGKNSLLKYEQGTWVSLDSSKNSSKTLFDISSIRGVELRIWKCFHLNFEFKWENDKRVGDTYIHPQNLLGFFHRLSNEKPQEFKKTGNALASKIIGSTRD